MTIEVGERARIVLSMNTEAYFLEPHAWPEVLKVFDLFGAGWKKELGRPGPWDRDPGTRAAVSLLACFTLEQIARVAENIDRNPVIRQGNRALACVSPEVARRTLSGDFGAAGGRRNEPVQQNNTDPFSKHEVVR